VYVCTGTVGLHDDKLAVDRYYFDRKINPLLNGEMKAEYFEWWMDAQNKNYLKNLYMEANSGEANYFLMHNEGKKHSGETLNIRDLKLPIIRQLLRMLDFRTSIDDKRITMEQMKNIGEYLDREKTNINKMFLFRDRTTGKCSNIVLTEMLLKKKFASWNGGTFCNSFQTKKTDSKNMYFYIDSKAKASSPYVFNLMKEFNPLLIEALNDPIIQTNIIENVFIENEAIKNVIIENDVDTNYEYVEVEDVRFIRNMTQKEIDLKIKKGLDAGT
jgi:hypothetical protein